MERKNRTPHGKNPVTAFLALVLLITTVVTPFIYYAPKNRLARAVEKSRSEFSQEEVLRFFSRVLWDGSFEAKGERGSLSYTATLPKSAALTQRGNLGNCRVALQGDELYLQSDTLGEAAFSAPREGADISLCDSAFSDAGMPDLQLRFLRTALVLSDADFVRSMDTLERTFEAAFRAGKPKLVAVADEIKIDGKNRNVTNFTYEMDEEGLKKAFASWKNAGKRKETQEAFSALRGLLSATLSKEENQEAALRFVSFLSGESSEFDDFEKNLVSKNSRVCLTLTVYKGRVMAATFLLGGGDFFLEAKLSLSEKLRKNSTWSASLQAKMKEKQLFSLSFASEISEDSKSALIRKWNYSFSDAVGAICPASGEEAGEITFSWGKEKGDLGLRMNLGEDVLVFRGELMKYKKDKKLSFEIGRVELNGEIISEDDSYTVTLFEKGKTPTYHKATENLFPEGEKRQKMAELLAR